MPARPGSAAERGGVTGNKRGSPRSPQGFLNSPSEDPAQSFLEGMPESTLESTPESPSECSSNSALCLSPYLSSYLPPYRTLYVGLCRGLCRHVCLHLDSDPCRDLYREPHPTLYRMSYRKPHGKPNPALFCWLYGFEYRQLYGSVNLAPCRQIQPGGRPVGRGVDGRIVVTAVVTTTYRCPSASRLHSANRACGLCERTDSFYLPAGTMRGRAVKMRKLEIFLLGCILRKACS